MGAGRLMIYNQQGQPLVELDSTVEVTWALNDMGVLQWAMSTLDDKARESYLRLGNLVWWQHEKLPSFGGVISTPRNWKQGTVVSAAYTPHILLASRSGSSSVLLEGSAGDLFSNLIEMANKPADTRIRVGDVYAGGTQRQEKVSPFNALLKNVQGVAARSGNEYDFEPTLEDGTRLVFTANWAQRLGAMMNTPLIEGLNIELTQSNILSEQGDLWNEIIAYGDGTTDASRPTVTVRDEESITLYGLRQQPVYFQGYVELSSLKAAAEALLAGHKDPRRTFILAALDAGNTWHALRLGNVLPLTLYNSGYSAGGAGVSTWVRIHAIRYIEGSGKVDLVVDEVVNG